MESKEIREAKALEASLLANRYKRNEPKPPDFPPLDIVELDKEIPGILDGLAGDGQSVKECEKCGGTIKRLYLPNPFGKFMPADAFRPWQTCPCVIAANEAREAWEAKLERKRKLQRTYAKNIMAPSIADARFSNFVPREGTETAFRKAKEFREKFSEDTKVGLLLFGSVGNGKSHLARAIEYELDMDGWATLFLDWPQLVELAKATFKANSRFSISDYVRAAIDADLLVLDEIGAGTLTEFEFKELLFPIVNGRSGKGTIYTTNLNPDRLEKWFASPGKDGKTPIDEDGRLIDRILGNCDIVINRGTSKRKEDAKRRIEG